MDCSLIGRLARFDFLRHLFAYNGYEAVRHIAPDLGCTNITVEIKRPAVWENEDPHRWWAPLYDDAGRRIKPMRSIGDRYLMNPLAGHARGYGKIPYNLVRRFNRCDFIVEALDGDLFSLLDRAHDSYNLLVRDYLITSTELAVDLNELELITPVESLVYLCGLGRSGA